MNKKSIFIPSCFVLFDNGKGNKCRKNIKTEKKEDDKNVTKKGSKIKNNG